MALAWSLVRCRRVIGLRVRLGRFEADRIERAPSGQLFLVEVRSRRTCKLALLSVGRVKRRRLAVMARRLANVTGESVTVQIEAVGGRAIVRKVVGVVHPDALDHN